MRSWKKGISAFLCAAVLLVGTSYLSPIRAPSAPVLLGQASSLKPSLTEEQREPEFSIVDFDLDSLASQYGYQRSLQGYLHLGSEDLRNGYRILFAAACEISDQKNVDNHYPVKKAVLEGMTLSKAQVLEVITALRNDNPQLFWLMNDLRYGVSNGNTVIQLCSCFSGAEIQAEVERVKAAVRQIVQSFPSDQADQTEFDRELYLHDVVTGMTEYSDEAAQEPETDPMAFSAYGALVNGKSVCEGYSRAMQLLANCMGLSCTLVTGVSEEQAHMWNVIRIDGNWYHLDLTWDDIAEINLYQYFNLTDQQIALDHQMDPIFSSHAGTAEWEQPLYNLYVPLCQETAANYYQKKAVWLDSMDGSSDQEAMDAIVRAVDRGETTISYQFDSSVDFDLAVSMLLTKEPYKFFYYVRCANDYFGEQRIQEDSAQYVVDQNQRAVTIQLLIR